MQDLPDLYYLSAARVNLSFIAAPTPVVGIGATFIGIPPLALLKRSNL